MMLRKMYYFTFFFGLSVIILMIRNMQKSGVREPVIRFGLLQGWLYNTSRNTSLYIQPNKNSSLLIPDKFCKSRLTLLIMVVTEPHHHSLRMAIRETWGLDREVSDVFLDIYYLMGRTLNETLQKQIDHEFHEYDDIIQEDFMDTYHNLTVKSLMMLKVVATHCLNAVQFVMKTDDDVYIHVPKLVALIRNVHWKSGLLIGEIKKHPKPFRTMTSKWYAPYYLYKKKYYPDFLAGAGYVMSVDVLVNLYAASLRVPIYHLEDVFLTGILAEEAHIQPRNHPGFTSRKRNMKPCLYKYAINTHRYSETEIRELHNKILRTNLYLCKFSSKKLVLRFSHSSIRSSSSTTSSPKTIANASSTVTKKAPRTR